MSQNQKLREGIFTIDDTERYKGYTLGEKWNGYERPYFESDEAIRILSKYETWIHGEAQDAFVVVFEPNEFCIMPHVDIEGKYLYDFGSCGWCWDEVCEVAVTGIKEKIIDSLDLLSDEELAKINSMIEGLINDWE